jgi:hypothetical protein
MSVDITDELKQLNISLSKKPKDNFSDFVEKNLKARISQFESYRSRLEKYNTLDKPQQTSFQQFSLDLDHDVFLSCEYGAAAYETTYTATIVVRALYKYLGRSQDDQKPFFEKIDDCYKSWLDATKDNSPAKLENDEGKRVDDLAKQLSDIEKSNTFRRWMELYYQTQSDYERHVQNKKQLEEVVSQLDRYHGSLLDVIKGGRLLLATKGKRRPS